MTMTVRLTAFAFSLLLAFPLTVSAQGRDTGALAPTAGTSFAGDTGLWFVPAADVLPAGVLSAGVAHATESRDRNAAKLSYTGFTLARGFGGRAEVFGTWQAGTELDNQDARGDALAGVKFNLLSERRRAPLGVALRGVVKLPIGDDRVTSGEADLLTEIVASRLLGSAVEITGSTGYVLRGEADDTTSNGLRSGIGVGVMAHPSVRVFTEVHGEIYRNDDAAARLVSPLDTPTMAAAGISWHFTRSMSVSAGLNRPLGGRSDAQGVGALVRFGFRPGARRAPAAAPASATPDPAAAPTAPPAPATPVAPVGPQTQGPRSFEFSDVFFDFDRYTLRPAALPMLDQVVAALGADPAMRLSIEGYTCDVGTLEYNLALSERRANSVRDYLVSRGVTGDRLSLVAYGEERFAGDDFTEATRAANRRAAMTVNVVR
jgi:outer membrane protein OmpA-like peptidoglycan-associated protein